MLYFLGLGTDLAGRNLGPQSPVPQHALYCTTLEPTLPMATVDGVYL